MTSNERTENILKNNAAFETMLSSSLNDSELMRVLELLIKVYIEGYDKSTSEIFKMTLSNAFMGNINDYLLRVHAKKYDIHNNLIENFWLIAKYFDLTINELNLDHECFPVYSLILQKLLKVIPDVFGANYNQSSKYTILLKWIMELFILMQKKVYYFNNQPNNFYSDMSLYPNPVDFYEEKPVSPNKLDSPYKSTENYLDTQFNLFRNDYICAVRKGILQEKMEFYGAPRELNATLRVFHSVTVHSIEVSNTVREGLNFYILLKPEDEKRIHQIQLANQKPFMTGQLIYFSAVSTFTNFIIALVADGNVDIIDNENKKHRAIKVCVVGESPPLILNQKYTLIEPTVFFEPYYQVMKSFQFIMPKKLPMKKYIVDLDFSYRRPSYLAHISHSKINSQIVSLQDLVSWVPSGGMSLNEPQLNAFKNALMNEFTLIQGPPGTGKTHLVKAIINTLIDNKRCRDAPILLVCPRNSSLDHVLEPLSKSGRKVVRLGGQTKSATLRDCSVSNLKASKSNKNALARTIQNLKQELKDIVVNEPENYENYARVLNESIEGFRKMCDADDANAILSSGIDIIGATTTGAARLHFMMSLIKPEVVIIEEAAEVLEAHVVASIPESCQHLILIGDHLQLQPTPADHLSGEKYHMNISLFERLVRNGLKCHTLTVQHRMRPEISSLISPLIYEILINHKLVCNYPHVKGVQKSVFFLSHKVPQNQTTELKSYWNSHEAETLLALADYLTRQGYESSDITILGGYSAQVNYLTQSARKYPNLQKTRISAIDNYQGEENTIILLSLVRSGTKTIGFLKKHNRVNVALSRAKHGLYVMGNMDTLSANSKLWQNIKERFNELGSISNQLPLKCLTHKKINYVRNKEQILNLNGGCGSVCDVLLACGHRCKLDCHPSPEPHSKPCMQPCTRIICLEHNTRCTNRHCSEKCSECSVPVSKNMPCGHTMRVDCSNKGKEILCTNPCSRLRCTLHKMKCPLKCYESCKPHLVDRVLNCGHLTIVRCDNTQQYVECNKPCERFCERGHRCRFICGVPCPPCSVLMEQTMCLFFTTTVQCHDLD